MSFITGTFSKQMQHNYHKNVIIGEIYLFIYLLFILSIEPILCCNKDSGSNNFSQQKRI